uniref:Uncharacterized 44.4 kDa protein in transposon Tn4556 n=1 Tax=Streptomyces fradiae TaxID=1906 RepID=YT44_STRFR|nr:RecName: Full=Uncharacterized 44.4 kDa protein in transposon Tn4556 [Streptomyces fradiae]AAA88562.1 unknown protein [Streptomyces fradiae]
MRRRQDQAPPRAGEQVRVDLGRANLLAAHQLRQRQQRAQYGLTLRGGVEVHHADQQLQERADGAEPVDQHGPPCLVGIRVQRRGQLEQRGDRRGQLVPGHHLLDGRPHPFQALHFRRRDLPGVGVDLLARGVEHDLERGRQLRRRPLHARQRLQLLLRALALRPGQQLRRDQHLQQVQRVVHRPRREVHGGGQQRRQAASVGVPAQQRRLAVHPVPGQLRQPARRYPRHINGAHSERGDLLRPLQRPLHLRTRHPHRPAPQPVQLRDPLPGRHRPAKESSTARCPVLSIPCRLSHSRWFAASRTEATSLVSVVTPGSSTRRSLSHPAAASNNAFGPSPVVQARASTHSRSSPSASANSRYSKTRRSSRTCSSRVFSRSPYSFSTDGSPMSSCSAR